MASYLHVQVLDEGLQFGASVTLTRLMDKLHMLVKERPEEQTRTFKAMYEQLRYFAGPPIRNAAAVSGNICTGSPISDLNPIYMAVGATFYVAGKGTPERAVRLCNCRPPHIIHAWISTLLSLREDFFLLHIG